MTRRAISVAPTTRVASAMLEALEHQVTHLPVLAHGKVVGVVGVADLRAASTLAAVSSCMRAPAITITSLATCGDAARSMLRNRIGSLPVVDGDRFVGMLTLGDLIRAGMPEDDVIAEHKCAACGAYQHVRADPARSVVPFCASCLERAGPPSHADDLGEGD